MLFCQEKSGAGGPAQNQIFFCLIKVVGGFSWLYTGNKHDKNVSAPPSANDRIIKKPGSYKTKCAGISHRIAKLKIFAKLVSKTSTVGAKKAARLFCQVRQAYEFAKTVSVRPMAAATTIKTTSDTVEVKRRKPDSKNIGQAFFFCQLPQKRKFLKKAHFPT